MIDTRVNLQSLYISYFGKISHGSVEPLYHSAHVPRGRIQNASCANVVRTSYVNDCVGKETCRKLDVLMAKPFTKYKVNEEIELLPLDNDE